MHLIPFVIFPLSPIPSMNRFVSLAEGPAYSYKVACKKAYTHPNRKHREKLAQYATDSFFMIIGIVTTRMQKRANIVKTPVRRNCSESLLKKIKQTIWTMKQDIERVNSKENSGW